MNWRRLLGLANDIPLKPRYTGRITRQSDEDTLAELRWREAVQRNIQKRRALKLLNCKCDDTISTT